jgi:P4 family phage/plasmid primase-like protien
MTAALTPTCNPVERILSLPPDQAAEVVNGFPTIEAVRLYRHLGLAVTRIVPGTKRPARSGWQRHSLQPEDFVDGDAVGLLTGRLSGDVIALDLDGARPIDLALQFLPPTPMVEGRSSKPRSRLLYRAREIPKAYESSAAGGIGGPQTVHFRGAKIDFLGTGSVLVLPPSCHPTGERRVWHSFGQLPSVPFAELLGAARRLAQACGEQLSGGTRMAAAKVDPPARPTARCFIPDLPAPEERVVRAETHVSKIEGAVSGEGGHDRTFRVACDLVRGFALEPNAALAILCTFNERCRPPWSAAELQHKIEDADRFTGLRGNKLVPLRPRDPHSLARHVLATELGHLRYWRQRWWLWDERSYGEIDQPELRARVCNVLYAILKRAHWMPRTKAERHPITPAVTLQLVSNVLQALAGYCLVPHRVEMPSLLPSGEKRDFVAMRNGLLDVNALLQGRGKGIIAHSPDWFSAAALPYAYDPSAACPQWQAVLERSLSADAELVALMQEWFGYNLLPDTSLQRFVIMVGEGANGKSACCAALTAMLGEQNVSHIPLERFDDRFALTQADGKLANIASEVGEVDRAAEGILKAFTAGDRLTYDRKYRDAYEAAPTARLTLATNSLPRFRDPTNGLWRRLLLIPFATVIPPAERIGGMDRPGWWIKNGELPGILNWALEGLRRLRARQCFTLPAASARALREYRMEANPALAFLHKHCRPSRDDRVGKLELYRSYCDWCRMNGCSHPLTNVQFGKEVKRQFRDMTNGKTKGIQRHDAYVGLRYLAEAVDELDVQHGNDL